MGQKSRAIVGSLLGVGLVIALAAGASAEDEIGAHDPDTGQWYLRDDAGTALPPFFFGDPDDAAFMGDWDGDGTDTPGLFRPSDAFVYLRNSNTQGIADILYFFGNPDDIAVAGDFNGNGFDTVSLYRPSEGKAYVINKLGSGNAGVGAADTSYTLVGSGVPFAGDFDSDGVSTFGLYDQATGTVRLWNDHSGGVPDVTFTYGNPGDEIVAGDWDGNPTQTVGVKRDGTFYLRNSNTTGIADEVIPFGDADWNPLRWQDNTPPTITSDGGGTTASKAVPENTTAVTDVDSTDPQGETESGGGLTYSLSGSDSAKFSVDAGGMLAFLAAPDFETPGDVGANNVYDVTVTVTDTGLLTDSQDIEVTVTDANEAPPVATNDSYDTVGNTQLRVDTSGDAQPVTPPQVLVAGTVLGNDTDLDGREPGCSRISS